jgi:protein required for attachment to host cells
MANNKLWILVTDGSQAKIFHQENRSARLSLNQELIQELPSTHEHGDGKPGRAHESGSPMRHTYDPKTDWHEHQKEVFIKDLVEIFVKEHQVNKFAAAVLICPPKIIHILRDPIHEYIHKLPPTDKPLLKEITKDLTHLPPSELEKLVKELIIL